MMRLALAHPRQPALVVGFALAALSTIVGALLGFLGPLITASLLLGLGLAVWAVRDVEFGLWGMILIIALLPFGTMPFKFVLTPTLLDIALAGVFLVYLAQWMTGQRRGLAASPAHALIMAFMLLALFSFVAGSGNAVLTPNLLRKFAGFMLNVALAFLVADHVADSQKIARLLRVILLAGSAAALLGLTLYFIPVDQAERGLNALRIVNYPTGAVLRYIEDNPANALRAIGTSVDPNAFGGLLAIVGALAAPQLATARPLFGQRWPAWAMFALIVATLILTFSRTAMAALLAAIMFVTALRHRKLLWLVALAIVLFMFLPVAQQYSSHFSAGLQGQDLATRMRFGEYRDALTLISRYPLFGVGFGGTPDVDIYLGVSSAYLLLAEQMGLVGLGFFVLAISVVLGWGLQHRRAALSDSALAAGWLGVHAALIAALVIGLLDHYFVNLEFQAAQTFFWLLVGLALAATRLAQGLK